MPFMQNLCWEEDTLFMIFEEDFRFEPEEEDMESAVCRQASFRKSSASILRMQRPRQPVAQRNLGLLHSVQMVLLLSAIVGVRLA